MYKRIFLALFLVMSFVNTALAADLPVPFRITEGSRTLILDYPIKAGDVIEIDNQKSTTIGQGSVVLNKVQINKSTTARHILTTTLTQTQVNYAPNKLILTETVFTHWIDIYSVKVNGVIVFPIPDTSAPDNPTSVTATEITDRSLKLTWTAPTALDLKEVIIFRDEVEIARVPKGTNFFAETGLQPATEYVYKLISVDQIGNQSVGVITRASTYEPDTKPPGEITNISTTVYNDRIRITWKNPTDADYLEVKIYKEGVLIAVATTPATQFTDYDLQERTTYTYLFRSVDTSGNYSPGVTVTETTKGKPPKVTGVRGVAGYEQVDLNFDLSLDPDVTSYNIYQNGTKIQNTKGSTAHISSLTNGKTYQFQVSAVSTWGESDLSDPLELTPETWMVGSITNLRTVEKKSTKLKFEWDENAQAEKYLITARIKHTKTAAAGIAEYAVAVPEETKTFETTETSYELSSLSPGDVVDFSVSGYSTDYGDFGTASLSVSVPLFDAGPSTDEEIPHATDIIGSSFSLASNFWWFFLIGAAILLTPYLFKTARAAIAKKQHQGEGAESERRSTREQRRKIRLDLRR